MKEINSRPRALFPLMLCFFAMGFVDSVGVATHYIRADFQLSGTLSGLFATMVFLWFLAGAVPAGLLMNKIGRRKTVLWSLLLTAAAFVVPFAHYSFWGMFLSFAFLGLGNTLMQVSLNPLVGNLVSPEKLPGMLTLGQFVKAVCSLLAPVAAGWCALYWQDWKILYWFFLAEALLAFGALARTPIREAPPNAAQTGFKQAFGLLADSVILSCFIGIICHVGLDVGMNMAAPKLLMERAGLGVAAAGYGSGVYFLWRTAGCLAGVFLLGRYGGQKIFRWSMGLIVAGWLLLWFGQTQAVLYAGISCVGLGNANVFPVIFSQALWRSPTRQNEVSGLMIMGLVGGAVFPLLMGAAADFTSSQAGAMGVLAPAIGFLCVFSRRSPAGR